MLKDFVKPLAPDARALKAELKQERDRLEASQTRIKEAGLPVMVVFEGWGAAGKGGDIDRVIQSIDPRFFRVSSMTAILKGEKRYPFLHRYLMEIPEAGRFTFFDTYWMEEVCNQLMEGKLSEKGFRSRMRSINACERSLIDNGYLIMKFFLNISRKEQKRRIKALLADKETSWRVDEDDLRENERYSSYRKVYDRYLEDTSSPQAPWYIIDSSEKDWTELQVLRYLNQGIETALKNHDIASPILQNSFRLAKTPLLADVSLSDKTISKKSYEERLDELQRELRRLHYEIYRRRIPVVIVYEGWDAAGKGGNIKRLTAALDSRGYEVHPIASPEPHEKARHFLWRFWTRLPKSGHIAIFDRSWYGRVMVERVEGFCTENDWQRAYNEINEFEGELVGWGAVVIKFWVQIDSQTQLERFNERQSTPEKQWKITDEDWRNRDRWDDYETAVNEMLQKTSTAFAPWHILESNDKRYARIKALEIVVAKLKEACRKA